MNLFPVIEVIQVDGIFGCVSVVGQVIGATDKTAAQPTGVRYGPWDVAATIYQALGVNPASMLYDRQNRPIAVLPEGRTIPGVL